MAVIKIKFSRTRQIGNANSEKFSPARGNNVAVCISNVNNSSQRYCRAMQVSTMN